MNNIISKITHVFKKTYPAEIIAAVAVIGIIDFYMFPDTVGFFDSYYNPYFIIIIFFSVFYGKFSGFITLITTFIIFTATAFISDLVYQTSLINSLLYSQLIHTRIQQYLFVSLLLIIILGEIRDNLGNVIRRLKDKNILYQNQLSKLNHEITSLTMVNEEYQDRILGQQNSLISLYSSIIALNSLNLESIYPNILNAIVRFTGAEKCSIWKHNREESILELLSQHGWDEHSMSPDNYRMSTESITGWVVRNNVNFSIKMLQKYKNLRQLDKKENILTVPINIDNQVWGAINIEKMPFIKYNMYTEQLLMMIADLAAPIIRNAIRFNELTHRGEVHPVTGFHSLEEFFILLEEEFNRSKLQKTNLSLLIVELSNVSDLLESHYPDDVLLILKEVSDLVIQLTKGHAMIFQYKEMYQFAAILPSMDYDGTAMFSLSLVEHNSKKLYSIKGDMVTPEIIIGYSSLRPNHESQEDLVMLADNLILMQKI